MSLNVLTVSSEAFPLAKTGGLGDAVSGMCQAVSACGASVTLVLPAYRNALEHVTHVHAIAELDDLPGGKAQLLSAHCPELSLPVLLLKNDALYDRDGIYADGDHWEFPDNAIRFGALSHAALRIAQGRLPIAVPHIIHAHDWHAALVPLLLRQAAVEKVKSVLTLHNIAFQGLCPMSLCEELGIGPAYRTDAGAQAWGQLNFLKAGIRYADIVTTVSGNYAKEILTPAFGCGLQDVLRERAQDLVAVPNGIDTTLWDPSRDAYLGSSQFNALDPQNKLWCKQALQREYGLHGDPAATVLAMGSRLTTQKMADVAVQAIPLALQAHSTLQVCVLGQGDKDLERALRDLASRYPGRCGVHIGYTEAMAHRLHAGADILLHGSRFEPFGLTPLYAMRYGAIPIGSRVGGMVDTICDPGHNGASSAMSLATGVLFEGDSVQAMTAAIARTMRLRQRPEIWRAMQFNAMTADFSWANAAPAYMRLYQSLVPQHQNAAAPVRRHKSVRRSHRRVVAPLATPLHS